jgi:hypothetical protein
MALAGNALCLACGTQNTTGALSFAAKCVTCQATLRRGTLDNRIASALPSPMGWRSWAAILAGIAALIIWASGGDDNNTYSGRSYDAPYTQRDNPPTQPQEPVTFEAALIPIATGEVRFVGNEISRVAPLEIVTRGTSNYYIKLVNADTGITELFLYISGGERLEVLMPLGTYELKYASGDYWYGEELLFGPRTAFSRADAPFTFTNDGYQYAGYTVELYMQANGNLDVDSISAAEF